MEQQLHDIAMYSEMFKMIYPCWKNNRNHQFCNGFTGCDGNCTGFNGNCNMPIGLKITKP